MRIKENPHMAANDPHKYHLHLMNHEDMIIKYLLYLNTHFMQKVTHLFEDFYFTFTDKA